MVRNVKTASAALSRTDNPVDIVAADATRYAPPRRVVRDGLENVMVGLGTDRDKASYSVYMPPRILQRQELENMYRVSWLAKRIINLPAEDMTREWRAVMFDSKDDKHQQAIERLEKKHAIKHKITEALQWSRLYGGALAIIGTKDKDMSKPLDITKIKKGDFQWLQIVDRWRVAPGTVRTTDLDSPNFGLPEWYILAESSVQVHHTRVLRFNGSKLPYFAWLQNAQWDDSELQHVLDSITTCDATTRGIATMIFEANVDVIKVEELNELLGHKDGEAKLIKRFQTAAMMKSFNRTLILGHDEEYDKKSNSFANLDKILTTFQVDICGAADIPMTRLFGQSAAGLQSTGDGELRNYYDMISAKQESNLRPQLEYLDEIMVRSELGVMPDDYRFDFNSLWQQSDAEVATTEYTRAQRDQIYYNMGAVPAASVARDLKEAGTYKNLTDEDIDLIEELDQPLDENGVVGAVPGAAPGAKPEPAPAGTEDVKSDNKTKSGETNKVTQ